MRPRAAVVGAGAGGMCAAALLAKQGYDVTVFEKNRTHGGRARTFSEKGFRFDMGPSWYLMPEVFESYFRIFGWRTSDYFRLKRLDPYYRVFYEDGTVVDITSDPVHNRNVFESLEHRSSQKLQEYLENAKSIYSIAMGKFIMRSYDSLLSVLDPSLVSGVLRLGLHRSLDSYVSQYFTSAKIAKIMEYTSVFLGTDPRSTPAMYCIMSHVDQGLGVWYPEGGIGRLMDAFRELAESQGARFKFNAEVERIEVEGGRVKGVRVNGKLYEADVVLVNADYEHADQHLLAPQYRTYSKSYWESRTLGPSGFIVFLGIRKRLPSLAHHSLFFADDWNAHFDDIFRHKRWPKNPSYYVKCTSKDDPSVAPKGCENVFIFVPVAPGLADSDRARESYFRKVLAHFEKYVARDEVAKHIIVKRIYSQRDFASDYNAYMGNALGLAHTLFQTAMFRPRISSPKVKGLYYAGHYTHPGVGLPMVVLAAQIAATEIAEREK
ncbi:MAG: phytoene desaturase family protein [Candidatus Micrarchaeia archaeon]